MFRGVEHNAGNGTELFPGIGLAAGDGFPVLLWSRPQLCRIAHTAGQGQALGAGTQAILLGAAIDNRVNAGALLHIEGADALGRMDLVSAHGHKVDGQLFHLQGQLP